LHALKQLRQKEHKNTIDTSATLITNPSNPGVIDG